jgi:hypothetical protein
MGRHAEQSRQRAIGARETRGRHRAPAPSGRCLLRAALEERTRERVPLDWATTQNNLGNALSTLGKREAGTARLHEAVEAYRAALRVLTRENTLHQWELAQANLRIAEARLAERR